MIGEKKILHRIYNIAIKRSNNHKILGRMENDELKHFVNINIPG